MANADGLVTEADVRAAQAALDELVQLLQEDPRRLDGDETPAQLLEVLLPFRGVLAGVMADVRTAGYLEGVQRGRQEAAHVVLDALQGEGLAP